MPIVDIVPLSRKSWPALAELFAAGGDPKWCWYPLRLTGQLGPGWVADR
jgi:hypothetical protein